MHVYEDEYTVRKTTDYEMFTISPSMNRAIDVAKHSKLQDSIKQEGYYPGLPIVCVLINCLLVVIDGQHRLTIAKQQRKPVYYIVIEKAIDIAQINSTAKLWTPRDYATVCLNAGQTEYATGLQLSKEAQIPESFAFALLAGSMTFSAIRHEFQHGGFRVKDQPWTNDVMETYQTLVSVQPTSRGVPLLKACMAVCRVKGFNPKRMKAAEKCPDKLKDYVGAEYYIQAIEDIYNYGRQKQSNFQAAAKKILRNSRRKRLKGEGDDLIIKQESDESFIVED